MCCAIHLANIFLHIVCRYSGPGVLDGSLSVLDSATVDPIGTLNVTGDWTMAPAANFLIDLSNTTAALLNIQGTAYLNGYCHTYTHKYAFSHGSL